MEDIFDIKNNFIPPKTQEFMGSKFGRQLGRDGNMLGTETVIENGSMQAVESLPIAQQNPMDQPIPVPEEKIEQETY
tara:strand:- start:386 stop:616 length:231 start_codon:yes stop_codon:yes gene_type:complete